MPSDLNESVTDPGAAAALPLASTPSLGGADPLGALNQLESHFGAIKRMHAEVAQREATLGEGLTDLARRREALEAELARVGIERQAIDAERQELQLAQQDALAQLKLIDESRRELETRSHQVAAEREQIARDHAAASQLAQELEERESRVQTDLLHIEAREQTLAAQTRKLEAEQTAREAVVHEKEIAVAQRERSAGKDSAQLRREVESLRERLAAAEQATADAAQRAASLTQQLDALARQHEAHLADVQARLAESTAALASRDAHVAHLQSELDSARQQVQLAETRLAQAAATPPPAAPAPPPPDLSKYETAIRLLTERLKKSDADKRSLSDQLEKALDAAEQRGAPAELAFDPDSLAAHVQRRRARLRRYKGLLQAQARKLVHAQSSLDKRQSEAEQVLAQRSRIVAAMTSLQRREAEANKQKTKSATAAMLFYLAAGLGVLLALSWGAAYKLAPATYAARAILRGDGQGRAPSDNEFVAWQQYVHSLVDDPQLIEQTAERLDRRGISELASGGSLRQELKSTLYADTSIPHCVTFEIRGERRARTEIVLDTLVSTIVSMANGTRAQRPDGISAEIQNPASAGDGPVADQRLLYTGGIFAASSTVFLSFGLLIGRRLTRLKRADRSDDLVSDALGDSASDGAFRDDD